MNPEELERLIQSVTVAPRPVGAPPRRGTGAINDMIHSAQVDSANASTLGRFFRGENWVADRMPRDMAMGARVFRGGAKMSGEYDDRMIEGAEHADMMEGEAAERAASLRSTRDAFGRIITGGPRVNGIDPSMDDMSVRSDRPAPTFFRVK